jgi:hypothetical protein
MVATHCTTTIWAGDIHHDNPAEESSVAPIGARDSNGEFEEGGWHARPVYVQRVPIRRCTSLTTRAAACSRSAIARTVVPVSLTDAVTLELVV